MKPAQIGASILASDLLKLGEEMATAEAAGVDYFHVDIMDGMFVPNITFGSVMVRTARRATRLPLDVHLMIDTPDRYIREFAESGADILTLHYESTIHVQSALQSVKDQGVRVGIALNPATPLIMLEDVLSMVDQVLIMSVNPGFGGQSFIPGSLDKIQRMFDLIQRVNPTCNLEVDGGIKAGNIAEVRSAGADMFVVGSGLYNDEATVLEEVSAMRVALDGVSPRTQIA